MQRMLIVGLSYCSRGSGSGSGSGGGFREQEVLDVIGLFARFNQRE